MEITSTQIMTTITVLGALWGIIKFAVMNAKVVLLTPLEQSIKVLTLSVKSLENSVNGLSSMVGEINKQVAIQDRDIKTAFKRYDELAERVKTLEHLPR